MKKLIFITISLTILATGSLIAYRIVRQPVTFTVYGLTTDALALQNLKSILEISTTRGDIELEYYPPIIVTDNQLTTTYELTVSEEFQESVIEESLFLEHLIQQNSTKAIRYINARLTHFEVVDWEPFVQYADAESILQSFQQQWEDEAIFDMVQNRTALIEQATQNTQYEISQSTPFVVLGEELGLTQTTVLTPYQIELFASKIQLRDDINTPLADPVERSLWDRLTLRSYTQSKVKEAYLDRDCNENPQQYGSLVDINTPFTRCVYTEAPALEITFLERSQDSTPTEDDLRQQSLLQQLIQTNIKNVSIQETEVLSEELIQSLELSPETFSIAKVSGDIALHPVYDTLVEQNYLIEVNNETYIATP